MSCLSACASPWGVGPSSVRKWPTGMAAGAFVATLPDGVTPVVVTVHPAAPRGVPTADLVQRRVARVRDLQHPTVDAPLADGAFDGRAWVIETLSSEPLSATACRPGRCRWRTASRAVRDLARVLVVAHRRGITHGAIDLESVRITADGARLGGLAGRWVGRCAAISMHSVTWRGWCLPVDCRRTRPARSPRSVVV